MSTCIYCDRPSKVPRTPHWAILFSRTHDDTYGGTDYHVTYQAYLDKAEWEAEINRLEQQRGYSEDYTAIEVRPAAVERRVVVTTK